jgi:nucleoside-diphosphate-sugar epimerase
MMSKWTIFGAGPIGRDIASLAGEAGHEVLLVSRSGTGPEVPGVTRVAADAADGGVVADLAMGSEVIINALNPAYHRWVQDWPPMADALLAGAERSGALLITISNLYGYGPVDGLLTEDLPLSAAGPKGAVRARMFADALRAHEQGRVRMVELRAGDYIGPGAESHMGDRVVPRILAGKRSVSVLGAAGQPHTWTYTHDVARLTLAVAADPAAWGRAWHVPSNRPRTQQQVVQDFADYAGEPTPRVKPYSPAMLWVAGRFSPVIRELGETTYQFDRPFVMDSSAAEQYFAMAPTDWQEVISATVESYRPTVESVGADRVRR